MTKQFTHLDAAGNAQMVDVADKPQTVRFALARGIVRMSPQTLEMIREGGHKKGDVLAVARIAGIQAAKATSTLIPLCHPLALSRVNVDFELGEGEVEISAGCKLVGQTGVEMEALTAVSVAALTIYDMCKAVDKEMSIEQVRLEHKEGGRSGTFTRSRPETK